MAITMKKVAEAAGVSIATVSHVVNKSRYVSKETAKRVLDAIEELGYYQNVIVGSIRSKKTYTIGLVLPVISNEIFGTLAEKIQSILFKKGYNLMICNTSYDQKLELDAFNTLLMKKADAIIAVPSSLDITKVSEIKEMGIPIVLVDRVLKGFDVDCVRVDNYRGTYDITKHLIGLGHRNIGYIDRKAELSHSLDQRKGYIQALEDSRIKYDPGYVINAEGYAYVDGVESVKRLIAKAPSLTAVLCYFDVMALGAMRGLIELGYSVPGDISVAGYDGMPFTAATIPSITTVSIPVENLAKKTCSLVLKRLKQKDDRENADVNRPTSSIVLAPELTIRESTAPPRRPKK